MRRGWGCFGCPVWRRRRGEATSAPWKGEAEIGAGLCSWELMAGQEWHRAAIGEGQAGHWETFLNHKGDQTLKQASWRDGWCSMLLSVPKAFGQSPQPHAVSFWSAPSGQVVEFKRSALKVPSNRTILFYSVLKFFSSASWWITGNSSLFWQARW